MLVEGGSSAASLAVRNIEGADLQPANGGVRSGAVFGVQYLKPLVLRDVASAIDMHESTVSRVTNNKYISTPRGMLELKYFFSSSIASSAGGDALSAEAVKARIKALVDSEEPNKILSDDRIVEILVGQGIDIARRTVAKYRDAMRIPSSVQRRRQKSIKI